MSELATQPNMAKLAVWFLLDQPEVTALVGDRIFTDPPANATFPMLRVVQAGGPTDGLRWVGQTFLQVSAWGPGKGDRSAAYDLAEVAAASMKQRLSDTVTYGGVTAVIAHINTTRVHDDTDSAYAPPKPRSWFTALIFATPTP